ncbi:hypothetical protein B9P82_19450 [Citrobacter sp. L55]|uniref:Uncharacterized protein n=1 Tax=Citrobacter braakii TaxID=57706 RepID=A0A1V8NVB9_CITBR|nr:hypothetical protein BZK42_19815 [Citrobacter braakii]PLC61563.1 hypothetical protein B9P82_19450 [Citrobacter sp. L55]
MVIKGSYPHLNFLTPKCVNTVNSSRNGGKDREMRKASHPPKSALLVETVNNITFTFAMLPAANWGCHCQEGTLYSGFLD